MGIEQKVPERTKLKPHIQRADWCIWGARQNAQVVEEQSEIKIQAGADQKPFWIRGSEYEDKAKADSLLSEASLACSNRY